MLITIAFFAGALAAVCVVSINSEQGGALAVAEVAEVVRESDDPPAPAAKVAPIISPESQARAKDEFTKLVAKEKKRVVVTIAKAKRDAAKARNTAKIAHAKAKLAAKVKKAKDKAAKVVTTMTGKEAHEKAKVKKSKDKVAAKIKKMFDKAGSITVKERAKLKVQDAARTAKYKKKMDDIDAKLALAAAAKKVVYDKRMADFKAADAKEKADEKAFKKSTQDKVDAVKKKTADEATSKQAVKASELAEKKQVENKYNAKLAERTARENKDKAWAAAHDPFKIKYDRLSRRYAHDLRKGQRERSRKWRRKVSKDAAQISRKGRHQMRLVRQMARQASRDIELAAKKKHKEEGVEDVAAPIEQVALRRVQEEGQHAEFQYDAAEDASDKAWADTREKYT